MNRALYSRRVILPEGMREATLFINNDRISNIERGKVIKENYFFEDFGNDVIMSGLIDSHVHINEPGRTEWEGFDSASKSAAAGGITTLIDMPLNSSPVTTSKESFEIKLETAKSKIHVNCGFWGGLVPDNVDEVSDFINCGVMGVKAFLCHSGIEDFPNVSENELRKAMPAIKEANLPLLVHCELVNPHPDQELLKESPSSYDAYLKSRPKSWEDDAIAIIIKLCSEFNVACHIVHLSSADSLPQIRNARKSGIPLTVETCPHYLFFNSENIPNGATEYKCAPPIREKLNNDLLWDAIKDGHIDFIVTDHSPAPPELKEIESHNFEKAWGGIAGLQLSLPVVWTRGEAKGLSLEEISKLTSYNVAQFLNMDNERGIIAKGYYADLVIWAPEETFVVNQDNLHHRHKLTPYVNYKLSGVIKQTYVSGYKVFDQGEFPETNRGNLILK